MTVLSTAAIGAGLVACSGAPARPGPTAPSPAVSSLLSLSCSESAGQQGLDGETVTGGVEGLVLPGSDDPAGLYPIGSAGGTRYFIYKAFLAVAASAAPFATVSVTRPASARLVYGSPSRMGTLFSADSGRGLLAASRSRYGCPCAGRANRLHRRCPVTGPGCVTFEVSSAVAGGATVTVPIGTATC